MPGAVCLLRQTYYDRRCIDRRNNVRRCKLRNETVFLQERQSRKHEGGSDLTEISSDVIRGYNDTMILFLILNKDSYGYEISKMIRTMSDQKYIIKETTLYSAFSRMEKNGYIESFSQIAENGKKRTYYRITGKGRNYYNDKCAEWELTKDVIERFIVTDGGNDGNS